MKHAAIFTRLAQRADPNIPILEAAMDEIARLEEKLETSGYSPFTEEVEDILRSKNQNLFNALAGVLAGAVLVAATMLLRRLRGKPATPVH